MKFLICVVALALLASSASPDVRGGQLLYLAEQGEKRIVAFRVGESGELSEEFRVELPGSPGPMAFSPMGDFVYVALTGLEAAEAGVATLARAADGGLSLKSTANITSRAPYIRTSKDGGLLLAAHYGAGDVTVYRIEEGVCTGELLDHRITERTAHSIELDPSGRFAFVPHTTPNKVYQFLLDPKTGKLTPNDPPLVEGPDEGHQYHQPRHYVHHPKLALAYTSNERGGGISRWKFDPQQGTLTLAETISTLPPDFEGNSAAADIHITPDGRFAYVSNRDLVSGKDAKPRDTLAGFALDAETGKMRPIGHFPAPWFPRTFCIDLTGSFIYAAGQKSDTMFGYSIDPESGKLTRLATYETGKTPIWVMCGRVEND